MLYIVRPEFTVRKNGVLYTGGQSVELSASEFAIHRHKLEGVSSTVNNFSTTKREVVLNLVANTWTDFAPDTVRDFRVQDANNKDVTDNFDYQKQFGQWQIMSLTDETNLKIYYG